MATHSVTKTTWKEQKTVVRRQHSSIYIGSRTCCSSTAVCRFKSLAFWWVLMYGFVTAEHTSRKLMAAGTGIRPAAAIKRVALNAARAPQQAAVKPVVQPAQKPAPKPVAQPMQRPAAKAVQKPAAKPAAKPTARPAAKSAAQPAHKPAPRPVAKPVQRPVQRPAMPTASTTTAAAARAGAPRQAPLARAAGIGDTMRDVHKRIDRTAHKVNKGLNRVGKDVNKGLQGVKKEVGKGLRDTTKDVGKTVGKQVDRFFDRMGSFFHEIGKVGGRPGRGRGL
ncbi:hypothetical protein COO60DRAFT_930444 [Scenedesmus sp. NREL 46B-D3]|nr:hypothetical protein COO60DRAFT_930444 [Scenedesmus sp. NREL 46B-D3]